MQMLDVEKALKIFYQKCAEHHLKMSPQRVFIYQELLNATDHPSIDDVFKRVRNKLPEHILWHGLSYLSFTSRDWGDCYMKPEAWDVLMPTPACITIFVACAAKSLSILIVNIIIKLPFPRRFGTVLKLSINEFFWKEFVMDAIKLDFFGL